MQKNISSYSRAIPLHALALGIALALPSVAMAEVAADATDFDEIVVTGTRTEVALEDSLVPAQVIDREEIERSQARSLQDLLKGRAGVNFTNQGGAGKLTTLFLRGAESDHVLVLVDGIRVGSATSGLSMFQDLPVDQIERIEIIRGPRSSLYGSEAIGGVIQIFTRRGGTGFEPHLRIGAGSHNLREASAGFSNRGERGWISAEGAYQETDGINACRGSEALFQGCFADEPDLDGYRNLSLSLRGGVEIGDTLAVEGHFLNADNDNEFDGSRFGGNETSNTQRVLGGKLAWSPGTRVKVTAQAGRAIDKYHAYFREAGTRRFVDNFDTRRDTASVQADIAIADGQLLSAGGDWQRDEVTSHTGFTVTSRDNTAAFVEYQGKFGAHQLQASVRNDDNEQFGNHSTGSIGWGMSLGNDFKLNATYGTGFKAPTFNDLYYPFGGNPDLEPEESKSLNVGIGQYASAWNWTFNVYETRIDALTGYDSFFNLVQVDEARIRGAELTFATSIAGWDLSTQLSYVDPRADARLTAEGADNPNYGNLLPRRSPRSGRIDIDRSFGAFRFGTTVSGASARYDDAANNMRLGGYGTVDLRVEYAVNADWSLQARATNVFDRDYETIAWYNQPGREYGLSLRYQPAR
ncbi:TonB-dependent vitamin B12 receptor [Pseudoxanthomonas yeongjuensis]|uniref:TonB-dependent vitamin B12 receptor n=1 Tax=Pseudoxanthomonas yeongjuensis TaxID=377616 RepID=UPI0013907961|nr:TonB-dependent vitamin B12 receptor [Pseudoxanthomonas yeongjuensis]KAF1716990.1 TonB-dependent vitamin B12 receptor [Pseudoxanthomonas yeongjuensis]